MQLLCLLLGIVICSYGVKSNEDQEIKVLRRQWPRQKGTMVRILKRSTAIPADFVDGIEGPDGTFNEEFPADAQKWGLATSGMENSDSLLEEDNVIPGLETPKRSGLFLRASRGGSGLYLRTSRDPEFSLRNGMLLRSFKRSLKRGGSGLFLRASKRPYAKPRYFKKSEPGLFLRTF